jgi:hypothetical protein
LRGITGSKTVRIRQIKPAFWEDAVIESLPDSVKLFYIGTWQLADDGGTFEWNVAEIGRQLYGYQPRVKRERWVEERGKELVNVGRLEVYECGHAFVPKLLKHQRIGGTKALGVSSAHLRCSPQDSDNLRPGKERVRNGTEGNGGGVGEPPELTSDQLAQAAMNQSILDDPKASEEAKRVARKYLLKLGMAA